MLRACPRCQELVLDNSGECRKCQKKFAPDRLPPLNKFEAAKLLMDRQKEKAQIGTSAGPRGPAIGRLLRYPLYLIASLLGLVSVYLLLHLIVMDLTAAPALTAAVAGMTLVGGLIASALLERATFTVPVGGGRIFEIERQIRLLEDEVERLKKER